jgi:hypothetical protein
MKKTIQKNLLLAVLASLSWMSSQAQPLEWGGRFGGIGEDVVRKLYVDPAGNSYTTGYFTDNADFDITSGQQMATSNGFFDVFVQKTGPDGNLAWVKSFGSMSPEYGTGITADAQGNVYVTGVFDTDTDFDPGTGTHILSSNGQQDIFLVKLDAAGNFSWAGNVGGGAYDESTSVGVDGAGNIYLSGYFNDTADFNPGPGTFEMTAAGMNDNFVAKFSASGELIWAKQYGSAEFEAALAMQVTAAGDQYITGFYNGTADFDPGAGVFEMTASASSNTGFLLKLNNAGDFQLARSFAGTENVISYDIDLDASGNIYLAGNFAGTIDLDPGAGSTTFTSVQYNGFVVKLNTAADFVWGKTIASAESVIPYTVDVNTFGYVMTSGFIETNTDFDPDPVDVFELALSSGNAMGAFISILDGNGDFVNALEFGGCNFADYHGAYTDADNNIYVAGAFETTVDLNPASLVTQTVAAMDFRDNYLLKLESIVFVSIPETEKEAGLSLFPNPAGNVTVLQVNSALIGETYNIYDHTGRIATTGRIESEVTSLDVSTLSKGLYVLHLQNGARLKFAKS